LEAAWKQLAGKGKDPLFEEVELTTLNEDECVEAFAAAQGYRFDSLHHEICLSDPRRVAPESCGPFRASP
jgi:hypothetical protein